MLFPDYTNSVHRGDQLIHHRSHEERLRGRKYPTSCIRDWQIRMRELFPPTGELSVNKHNVSIQFIRIVYLE